MYAATHAFLIILPIFHGKLSPAFTRSLVCMSKYSEELFINALPNSVSFSATNTSLSAYCRFTYERSFFTKFNVGDRNLRDGIPDLDDTERSQTVTGQLCVQVLSSAVENVLPYSTKVYCSRYSRFSNTKPSKKLWTGSISQ